MREFLFAKENFRVIQQTLGKRPGNYKVDPYLLRKGINDKPYFWNDTTRKWELVRLGDLFIIEDDGYVTHIPVDKVKAA